VAAEVTIVRVAPGRLRVEGSVTHANARAAYESTCATLADLLADTSETASETVSETVYVDLSGVTSDNSLVLSLMLSWLRQARQSGREIRFCGMPATLNEQIRFTGLATILPFAAEAGA
jgi:anti-anti-sigma factor